MQVRIDDRDNDGRGRGKAGRKTALVCQAYPGEEVVIRIDRSTRGTVQGRVARFVDQRDDRIEHPCEHELTCTGCPFLAASYDEERGFKYGLVVKALAAIDVSADVIEPVQTPTNIFGYRHYTKQVFAIGHEGAMLGSYVQGTHDVVDNRGCAVLPPALSRSMQRLVDAIRLAGITIHREPRLGHDQQLGLRYAVARQSATHGDQLLTLVTSNPDVEELRDLATGLVDNIGALVGVVALTNESAGNVLLAGDITLLAGTDTVREKLLGYELAVGPKSFFQVNPHGAEAMFRTAIEMAGAGECCVDAFAGVGSMSLALAESFGRVIAVERDPDAVDCLRASATSSERDNVEVMCGDARSIVPELLSAEQPDVMLLDPPRKGMGRAIAEALCESSVNRVVLLACDPGSLARDLPPLLGAGFVVSSVVPVDQFPRTAHVEIVVLLERGG